MMNDELYEIVTIDLETQSGGVSGTDFPIYNYRYHYSNNIRKRDFSLLSK